VLAREDLARFTVVLIGDIHIFIGGTDLTPTTETNFRGSVWLKPPNGPPSRWIRRRIRLI
jgi:hypothetical protein